MRQKRNSLRCEMFGEMEIDDLLESWEVSQDTIQVFRGKYFPASTVMYLPISIRHVTRCTVQGISLISFDLLTVACG